MRRVLGLRDSKSALELVDMGKARVVKEHTPSGPKYAVFTSSGAPCGVADDKWSYMFEAAFIRQGNDDGLLDGCSQTVGGAR